MLFMSLRPIQTVRQKEATYTALQSTDVQIKHSLHRACELPRVPLFYNLTPLHVNQLSVLQITNVVKHFQE